MTTRIRAIIVATFTSLILLSGLAGIIDYDKLLGSEGDVEAMLIADFLAAAVLSILLVFGTWWTLFFKRKGFSLIIIGAFPGMAVFPFLLLIVSIITSIFSGLGQVAVSLISVVVYWVVAYLLILTANVLNGSVLFNIPLGQAGKAAQFIFSLVSCYFLIAVLFGAAFPIQSRVFFIGLFVFYFAYSTIWSLKVPVKQVWLSAISIAAIMMLSTLLLSIWPIASVYATLSLVVMLYVMLNVALEMREKVGETIWIEYIALMLLVAIILFTNSNWGINGSII